MSALLITKREVITLQDSKGREFHSGAPILIRIKGQDIVCRYKGLGGGFFITETLDGQNENKYRQGSIEDCVRITGVRGYSDSEDLPRTEKEDLSDGEE